jgi:hypothetical protein
MMGCWVVRRRLLVALCLGFAGLACPSFRAMGCPETRSGMFALKIKTE